MNSLGYQPIAAPNYSQPFPSISAEGVAQSETGLAGRSVNYISNFEQLKADLDTEIAPLQSAVELLVENRIKQEIRCIAIAFVISLTVLAAGITFLIVGHSVLLFALGFTFTTCGSLFTLPLFFLLCCDHNKNERVQTFITQKRSPSVTVDYDRMFKTNEQKKSLDSLITKLGQKESLKTLESPEFQTWLVGVENEGNNPISRNMTLEQALQAKKLFDQEQLDHQTTKTIEESQSELETRTATHSQAMAKHQNESTKFFASLTSTTS